MGRIGGVGVLLGLVGAILDGLFVRRLGRANRQHPKAALPRGFGEQVHPGRTPFAMTSRSDPANQAVIRRCTQTALQRRPCAKRPVVLLGLRHPANVAERGEHAHARDALQVVQRLDALIEHLDKKNEDKTSAKAHHRAENSGHQHFEFCVGDLDCFRFRRRKNAEVTRRVITEGLRFALPMNEREPRLVEVLALLR